MFGKPKMVHTGIRKGLAQRKPYLPGVSNACKEIILQNLYNQPPSLQVNPDPDPDPDLDLDPSVDPLKKV